jgi:hypothetical protein
MRSLLFIYDFATAPFWIFCVACILLFFVTTQVLGTQVALMKNLPSILPCLVLVLPVLDVAQASASIFQNLLCSVADPNLNPDPSDLYVLGLLDPDPDPSITKQK